MLEGVVFSKAYSSPGRGDRSSTQGPPQRDHEEGTLSFVPAEIWAKSEYLFLLPAKHLFSFLLINFFKKPLSYAGPTCYSSGADSLPVTPPSSSHSHR